MPNTAALNSLLNASRPGTCAPDAAFVTLVANESYVDGAICLQSSLRRVNSACPLVLVVADPLPEQAMAQLSAAFKDIKPLSELRQRLGAQAGLLEHVGHFLPEK